MIGQDFRHSNPALLCGYPDFLFLRGSCASSPTFIIDSDMAGSVRKKSNGFRTPQLLKLLRRKPEATQLLKRAPWCLAANAWRPLCESQSLHLFQQLPRFTQQRLNLPSLGERIPGEQAVLARVLVCPWRAGSLRTAVHAAALLAVHRRRAARAAGTGFGATTRARQHRAGVSDEIAHACASRLASAEPRLRLERAAFGALRAADAGLLSETITLACCVTLPTMALPPSPTDRFCTVMAGSPWLR